MLFVDDFQDTYPVLHTRFCTDRVRKSRVESCFARLESDMVRHRGIVYLISGSVTASLIGYLLLMYVKEFGQLLIEIALLLEKTSRGLYYETMKVSYLCTAA